MITTILTEQAFLGEVQCLFNTLADPQKGEVAASFTLRDTKEQLKTLKENYTNLSDNADYQTIKELYNRTHKTVQEIWPPDVLSYVKNNLAAILKMSPPCK
jgi:hypothetical protein